MLKSLKFPIIYVVELLLWLPLLAGVAITASFLAAKPLASLDLQGKALPAHWEAAVSSHGQFIQGHLMSSSPGYFWFGAALVVASTAFLYPVHKAQAFQRQSASPTLKTAHTVAHVLVAALLLASSYALFQWSLVDGSAA